MSRARTLVAVEGLLARLPQDYPKGAILRSRAAGYAGDCGCKIGALYLAAALVVVPVVIVVYGTFEIETILIGVLSVFTALGLGKATGILLAWGRLAGLRLSLARAVRRTETGDGSRVELH